MCYLPPGPRCSNHAYREYLDAARKFAQSTDIAMKTVLGDRLAEKKAIYESTPKGQHELEREITDTVDPLLKEELKLRLLVGKQRREKQLEAYRFSLDNQDTAFREYMNENHEGFRKGRYQDACVIAALYLGYKFPERDFRVEGTTSVVTEGERLLVLPEKYRAPWGFVFKEEKFDGEDEKLNNILNTPLLNPLAPNVLQEERIFDWFLEKLKENGYTSVVSVNRKTMDTVLVELEDLKSLYSIQLSLKKKIGGSTSYVGDLGVVRTLIEGTVFEQGELTQAKGTYKTVLTGVPLQADKDCNLSESLYFAPRTSLDGDQYFELRRRHITKKFVVSVILTNKKQVRLTGASEKVFGNRAEEQETSVNEVLDTTVPLESERGKSQDIIFPTLPSLLN